MNVKYPGPIDAVEIAVAGIDEPIVATRGETVEVPDEVGESLIRQGWERVEDSTSRKRAASAASSEKGDS